MDLQKAQKAIADIKSCLEKTAADGFELDICTIEQLATISTIDDCIYDFEDQLKRKLTDEEKNTVKENLLILEKFCEEYINLQATGADEEISNVLNGKQEVE